MRQRKKKAVSFDSVTISPANRQRHIWKDGAVADAFEFQNQILEFKTEQLTIFQNMVRDALLDIVKSKIKSINIADIGTGSAGNIAKLILATIHDNSLKDKTKNIKEINLTISDIKCSIVGKARGKLQKLVGKINTVGRKIAIHKTHSKSADEIVPRMAEEQDNIGANFSLNYGDIDRAIFRLAQNVRPQGQVVLGLVNSHPKYSQLFNVVANRMNRLKNWQYYDKYLIMKEVGNAMDFFDIMRTKTNCRYISSDEAIKKLNKAGFDIEDLKKDTFCGIGFIVRAKRQIFQASNMNN